MQDDYIRKFIDNYHQQIQWAFEEPLKSVRLKTISFFIKIQRSCSDKTHAVFLRKSPKIHPGKFIWENSLNFWQKIETTENWGS